VAVFDFQSGKATLSHGATRIEEAGDENVAVDVTNRMAFVGVREVLLFQVSNCASYRGTTSFVDTGIGPA